MKRINGVLLVTFLFSLSQSFIISSALSFTSQRRKLWPTGWMRTRAMHHSTSSPLEMRDRSSAYWFSIGDTVRVVDNVAKAGHSLKGRIGVVLETWEKCDVDPTCCCAENVDMDMNIRVEFQGTEESETKDGSFSHYFGEHELAKVTPIIEQESTNNDTPTAFDGMSCKSFKLEHLKMGEQAKRIAAFEASRVADSDT
jgi:hypothetical protein